jgi:hypothetical protein
MICTTAGAGAWFMVHHSQHLAATVLPLHTASQNPIGALFFLPALLAGGLIGALVGGLVAPLR